MTIPIMEAISNFFTYPLFYMYVHTYLILLINSTKFFVSCLCLFVFLSHPNPVSFLRFISSSREYAFLRHISCSRNFLPQKKPLYTGYKGFPFVLCKLSLQIDKFFQQSIGNRNDSGVCLETSLCCDHFCKFRRKIYVTHFQNTGRHVTSIPMPSNCPEFKVAEYRLSPSFCRPDGFAKLATAICPSSFVIPLSYAA